MAIDIVSFPMNKSDFPKLCVSLPEGKWGILTGKELTVHAKKQGKPMNIVLMSHCDWSESGIFLVI